MKSLRDPETGCPWDKEQSMDSIRGYTLEEAYEVVDAIERGNMEDIRDELGDLLFHIIFYAEMANEEGAFDFRELVDKAAAKLERRHPHVFGDLQLQNSEQVKQLWEQNKQQERQQQKQESHRLLDDISPHQPAMLRALKLQKRAAGVGFDWDNSADIVAKIDEELSELKESIQQGDDPDHVAEELGDLVFCCINLARHFHIDPELSLRQTNNKFADRFNYIEKKLIEAGETLADAELEVMDRLWNEAKQHT